MEFDSQKQKIDLLKLFTKVWASKMLILKACIIGATVGVIVIMSTPKEFTAKVLMTPERTTKKSSSSLSSLIEITDVDMGTTITGRDAIYPSLYPIVAKSTPFIIRLFDISVRKKKDSTSITLAQYLKEHQKKPWWNTITSAPFKLVSWSISLLKEHPQKADERKSHIDMFRLTHEEVNMIATIASKIKIEIEKQKRTITIFVTMQDPLVAAIVADSVRMNLQEYITDYRTSKARRILKYNEELCKEAQATYYDAQNKYTRYADANRNLAMLTSSAELSRLQSEMNLAFSTYNQLELQVQAAKAQVEKVTPLYAVIQPAIVPLTPSKPNTIIILAGITFLCIIGSIVWILFVKDFVHLLIHNKNIK